MLSKSEKALIEQLNSIGCQVVTIYDCWSRLQRLHQLFKFAVLGLMQDINPNTEAIENLDTLLDLFLNENELSLIEMERILSKARESLKSDR